jgi:putative ABC transporter, ATP-binding protein
MISFQNVTYSYQENGEPKSLDSVNLEVNDGECILLCGKSGCGKTTMTRLLNGMIPNFYEGELEGKVLLDGKNLLEFPMYEISKRVGSVFQNPRTQFYTVNTTSEIAFGCENLGMEPSEIARRIEQTARDLQIEYLLNRNIFNLSGGEKQIIAFASIYAMSPQIYVLDEPSSNLDIQAIEKVRKILSLLKQQGKTIIIAEHRTYYLKDLVDRAIYMENGKIVQEYTMSELTRLSHEEQLHSGIRTVDLLSYPITPRLIPSSGHTIEITDIHCFYGQTEALSIPKLSIPSGRITAIIGTNGAGKSTFISWMCGLMKKARGTFLLDGNKQSEKERIRESYLVMQEVNHQLFSDSVREEIVLGNRDPSENRLHEIMEALDISELSERHPMTLSGGQKQRVIIASAMFCGKKILYFDEPTSGLDFSHMMQTCQLLKQLQREYVFLFIITHDYELIASVCDSVIHIEQGRLLEQYDLDVAGVQKLKMFFTQCLENRL